MMICSALHIAIVYKRTSTTVSSEGLDHVLELLQTTIIIKSCSGK